MTPTKQQLNDPKWWVEAGAPEDAKYFGVIGDSKFSVWAGDDWYQYVESNICYTFDPKERASYSKKSFIVQAERPVAEQLIESVKQADKIISDQNPMIIRNRILEIGTTLESLKTERDELIKKLADMGFQLVDQINQELDGLDQRLPNHKTNMSDYRNWKSGDVLECVDGDNHVLHNGSFYIFNKFESNEEFDDEFDEDTIVFVNGQSNGFFAWRFKWHSRPSSE